MKFKLLLVFCLLALLGCDHLSEVVSNDDSEILAQEHIRKHASKYEKMFKLAEKSGFTKVQWVSLEASPTEVESAWRIANGIVSEIDGADVSKFIEIAMEMNHTSLWLQKYQEDWLVRKVFSSNEKEGFFYFGNPENTDICAPQPQNSCYYKAANGWYIVKS